MRSTGKLSKLVMFTTDGTTCESLIRKSAYTGVYVKENVLQSTTFGFKCIKKSSNRLKFSANTMLPKNVEICLEKVKIWVMKPQYEL